MIDGARILLTGATGRLGARLACELADAGGEIVLIVRARSGEAARDRIRTALSPQIDSSRVLALAGDLTEPSLGLERRERSRVRASVDLVLHAAASTSFSSPIHEARRMNVEATANLLTFAERIRGLSLFGFMSTAFVAGRRTGRIKESELEHDHGFQNAYQRTKYEAELLVQSRRADLPVIVFRPSVILDAPRPGSPSRQSAFRLAFELVRRGLMSAVPGDPATPVDLVTERDAARAITRLLQSAAAGATYHVAGGDRAPRLSSILDGFGVRFLDEDRFAWELRKWRREKPRLNAIYDELACFIYELAYPKVFDTTAADAALGGLVTVEDPVVALRRDDRVVRPGRLGALAR